MMTYCGYRWKALRNVKGAVPVEHYCGESIDHAGYHHRCVCGAIVERKLSKAEKAMIRESMRDEAHEA